MANAGDHLDRAHHYEMARTTLPLWRRAVDVDPSHPKSATLFLAGGTVGWSLVGAILAFAPAGWVAPVLGVAFIFVGAQYVAWWRLGSSIFLLWPTSLRLIGRVVGLPEILSISVVYASMAWVAASLLVRHFRGVAPVAHNHHWIQALGAVLVLIGALPMIVLAIRDRFGARNEWVGTGPRARRSRIFNRAPFFRWAGQSLVALGTLGMFAILLARLG